MKIVGLVKGRHEIPAVVEAGDHWIYDSAVEDPTDVKAISERVAETLSVISHEDHIVLYVTGLTVVLVEACNWCIKNNVKLTLMHFNSATGEYFPQEFGGE